MLKLVSVVVCGVVAFASQGRAELLQAVRPGVMCVSADALAKLSLPDGSSRTAGAAVSPALEAVARAGECVDFGKGRVVILQTARRNTSIVRSDTLTGDGVLGTEVVANIDFVPYVAPHDAFYDVVRARCPDRLEVLVALGPPSYPFVQSLPVPVRSSIEASLDSSCSADGICILRERPGELEKRHLVTRWAEYVCAHKE